MTGLIKFCQYSSVSGCGAGLRREWAPPVELSNRHRAISYSELIKPDAVGTNSSRESETVTGQCRRAII